MGMWTIKYPTGFDAPDKSIFNEIMTIWPGAIITMAGKLVNLLSPDTGLPTSLNPQLHFIKRAVYSPGIKLPNGDSRVYAAARIFSFYNPGLKTAELADPLMCPSLNPEAGTFHMGGPRHAWSAADEFQFLIFAQGTIQWTMAVPPTGTDLYKGVHGTLELNNNTLMGLNVTTLCIIRRFNETLDAGMASHSSIGEMSSPKIHYAVELIPDGFIQ